MSNPLLPCPFCGGEAFMVKTQKCGRYVMCADCESRTAENETDYAGSAHDKATAAWNRRAEPVRMIDANKVVSIIKNVFTDRENGNPSFFAGLETAIELINNAPTIEPKEENNAKDFI